MDEKEELRDIFLKLLKSLRRECLAERDMHIERRTRELIFNQGWKRIGVYAPKDWEVPLWDLWKTLLAEGIILFFPRIKGGVLEYVMVEDINSDLREGKFGIKEPFGAKIWSIFDIDVFFIPGVAFDRRGARLGRGKGYIDRTFQDISSLKVGVAYSFQVLDFIPSIRHDVRMDFIIHEKGVIHTKGG